MRMLYSKIKAPLLQNKENITIRNIRVRLYLNCLFSSVHIHHIILFLSKGLMA